MSETPDRNVVPLHGHIGPEYPEGWHVVRHLTICPGCYRPASVDYEATIDPDTPAFTVTKTRCAACSAPPVALIERLLDATRRFLRRRP